MIDKNNNVERLIAVYSEKTDELVEELELSSFDLGIFQQAFKVPDKSDPMFNAYQIEPSHVDFISNFLTKQQSWDFKKYSYFLEAFAID
jgi:hypothetical protein